MNRDWLKGTELYDWLTSTGILTDVRAQLGHEDERCVRHWREGAAVGVYTADRILCKLGVCLGELPDSMYREPPEKIGVGRKLNKAQVAELRGMLQEGTPPRQIAETIGCSQRAVRHHKAALRRVA